MMMSARRGSCRARARIVRPTSWSPGTLLLQRVQVIHLQLDGPAEALRLVE